jgi:hypothetical protein
MRVVSRCDNARVVMVVGIDNNAVSDLFALSADVTCTSLLLNHVSASFGIRRRETNTVPWESKACGRKCFRCADRATYHSSKG